MALAGCPTLDVSEPIALVPGDDWTAVERGALAEAAECWNMRFGTRLSVGASDTIMQQTTFEFSDFVCHIALARTETMYPVQVFVCPTHYSWTMKSERLRNLFIVLLHELGHVLNIRKHATAPDAIMAGGLGGKFHEQDVELFREANQEFQPRPRCTPVHVRHPGMVHAKADTLRSPYCACP